MFMSTPESWLIAIPLGLIVDNELTGEAAVPLTLLLPSLF